MKEIKGYHRLMIMPMIAESLCCSSGIYTFLVY